MSLSSNLFLKSHSLSLSLKKKGGGGGTKNPTPKPPGAGRVGGWAGVEACVCPGPGLVIRMKLGEPALQIRTPKSSLGWAGGGFRALQPLPVPAGPGRRTSQSPPRLCPTRDAPHRTHAHAAVPGPVPGAARSQVKAGLSVPPLPKVGIRSAAPTAPGSGCRSPAAAPSPKPRRKRIPFSFYFIFFHLFLPERGSAAEGRLRYRRVQAP